MHGQVLIADHEPGRGPAGREVDQLDADRLAIGVGRDALADTVGNDIRGLE